MFNYLYKKIRLHKIKNKEPYLSLYKLLGFYPNEIALYEQAFLHRSSPVEGNKGMQYHNERLEFLGDAVLDAVIADILYKHFPNRREGYLTNTRSKIVQRENLNRIALNIGLQKMVVTSARLSSHNNYVYGNALEALIGAVYLDQGYRKCYQFVYNVVINRCADLDSIARKEVNFKSSLIEWSQKNKLEIVFDVVDSFIDNDGNPVFQSKVTLLGRQIGIGIGYSKKESQQHAAKMAIKKLRADKDLQRYISDLKKKQSSQITDSKFEELPEEPIISGTEIGGK
ncbi:MAG: ribonuclease III [Tannerellaceae bacterium]|nr:ribonuclease III [Tannerellaceae bacterium]